MDHQIPEDYKDLNRELFWKHLRPDGKSSVYECEKDGRRVIIKYELAAHSHEEREPEPRRKLRSRMKPKDGPPNQIPTVRKLSTQSLEECEPEPKRRLRSRMNGPPNQIPTVRKLNTEALDECEPESKTRLRSRMKPKDGPPNPIPTIRKQRNCFRPSTSPVEREELNWRKSMNGVPRVDVDLHYVSYLDHVKVEEDCMAYEYGYDRVVYEKEDCSSDLEIIESISSEDTSAIACTKQAKDYIFISTKYRRQIINVLKKPYDDEEYEKLLVDVEVRKPGQRHIELRNGRARSLPKDVGGKSYLDYYPDLEIKLNHFGDDKPRRLNLLRGFFFWLQNSVQSGAFIPWLDEECLAMRPKSKHQYC